MNGDEYLAWQEGLKEKRKKIDETIKKAKQNAHNNRSKHIS